MFSGDRVAVVVVLRVVLRVVPRVVVRPFCVDCARALSSLVTAALPERFPVFAWAS
ncbi:MAG: hypothetical protein HY613_01930 [Candidatus Rokubacteria bacterium]|nr:hypothetical protein [Candidatus Rokubacteria bacterium]